MSNLGDGTGTSIPTAVDTRQTYINGPNPRPDSSSRVDAEVVNDILASIIALETDLYRGRVYDSRTFTSIAQAISVIGSTQVTFLLTSSINASNAAEAVIIPTTWALFPLYPGIITKGSATSLTINGPVVGNPMHQWLNGFAAGGVTFGVIQKIYPQWWGVTTEDVKKAIAAAAAKSEIELGGIVYTTYDGQITIDKALTISSLGALTFSTNANYQGLIVTSSNVSLKKFTIIGPQYTALDNTQRGIFAYGADVNNYIENIVIENVDIHNWVQAIRLDFVKEFKVNKNKLKNLYTVGIQGISITDGQINGNYIQHIYSSGYSQDGNGITLTHNVNPNTEAANPVCKRINVIGNIIKEVPALCGIYLKGVEDCVVVGNNVKDCWNGIYLERRLNPTDIIHDIPNKRNVIANNVVWINHEAGEIMTLANTNNGITTTGGVYNVVWQANYNYAINDVVEPTVANGHRYRVTSDTGSSGATEPTWPTSSGGTVVDGGITWTEELGILNLNLGCIITGNKIEGYQIGVATSQTIDNIIKSNSISHVTRGIYLNGEDVNILVEGNTIRSLFAGSFSMAGIVAERGNPATRPNNSSGLIVNNVISAGSQVGIYNGSNYNLGINFVNNDIITAVEPYKHVTDLSYFEGNIHPYIKTSKSWTPGSIAAGASASVTHNILGLSKISRLSAIITPNTDLLGLTIGYAFTDDTPGPSSITLYLYNTSAGAIDIGTVTFYIEIRHNAA